MNSVMVPSSGTTYQIDSKGNVIISQGNYITASYYSSYNSVGSFDWTPPAPSEPTIEEKTTTAKIAFEIFEKMSNEGDHSLADILSAILMKGVEMGRNSK